MRRKDLLEPEDGAAAERAGLEMQAAAVGRIEGFASALAEREAHRREPRIGAALGAVTVQDIGADDLRDRRTPTGLRTSLRAPVAGSWE